MPVLRFCRTSSAGITQTDFFNSENIHALTNKFNSQFIVNFCGEVNSESTDTTQNIAD
jgi:hypothetical protein